MIKKVKKMELRKKESIKDKLPALWYLMNLENSNKQISLHPMIKKKQSPKLNWELNLELKINLWSQIKKKFLNCIIQVRSRVMNQ